MARVEFDLETELNPEEVRAALLDFSDRRPEIWPELDPTAYQVYSVGATSAEIREGSARPKVWARERYDWSDPDKVRWTVLESNFCKPGSFVEATTTPIREGRTRVHVEWFREPSSFKWRMGLATIVLTRGAPLRSGLRKALNALAARKRAEGPGPSA